MKMSLSWKKFENESDHHHHHHNNNFDSSVVWAPPQTKRGERMCPHGWILFHKVTQYSCDYNNLAPEGCVQYFFGSAGQQVQTYNYNNGNGRHLANQDQQVCVR